jgi:hypothetical protein
MNIQAEKIELTKLLLNTDNPSIIQSIKDIFKKANTTDFWDTLSFDEKKEIKEASEQIENGETTDYENFMSKHR